jgi:alpha-1,6-mannosyltransferase
MASGTSVVVDRASALPEVIGDAGIAEPGEAAAYAAGIAELLSRPERLRRHTARQRAEGFGWAAAVAGFLAAHGLTGGGPEPQPDPTPAPRFANLGNR